MTASNIQGIDPDGLPPVPKSLSSAIIGAVCDVISNSTGKVLSCYERQVQEQEEIDPAQVAMAVAYTSLCLNDPEMVTSSHLKMLRSNFSYEQIQELSSFIKKLLSSGAF